jgi:glycosyltransferase involved in cell wall biosynthesis
MKYSVIIPCFEEVEEDFRQCLDGIKNQTVQPYEVIVINDCGDKKFEKIVKEYGYKYLYNEVNLNNGGARNRGIREATGDYLIFCNADDYFSPNTIEEVERVNEGQDLILVGLRGWYKPNEEAKFVRLLVIPNERNTPNFSKIMCFGEPMHIVNRQFILDNDLFEIEHLTICDVDWCMRLEQAIKTYAYVGKPLYNWQVGHKKNNKERMEE